SLGDGDGVLLSNAAPWTIVLPRATRFLALRVPAGAVGGVASGARAARRISGESAALQLLARYIDMLAQCPVPFVGQLDTIAATHAHSLLAAALGMASEAREAGESARRAVRLRAVLAEIQANFADSGFSSASVGLRLGVSTRYVQDLLHDTDASFTERVLELKLQKARAMLGSARGRRIVDIAHACGFGDISHFNRCFRRRFGSTPTRFRDGAK